MEKKQTIHKLVRTKLNTGRYRTDLVITEVKEDETTPVFQKLRRWIQTVNLKNGKTKFVKQARVEQVPITTKSF